MRKVIAISLLLLPLMLATKTGKGVRFNPFDDTLLHKIARVESNHNDKAVSKKGAYGRYQIRYSVWEKELKKHGIIKNKKDLFDPAKNKQAALFVLAHYHSKTNNLRKTLYLYSGKDKNYARKVLDETN